MSSFAVGETGIITAEFSEIEAQLLRDLATQLGELLDETVVLSSDAVLSSIGIGGGDSASLDPAIARLLPDAYADDPDASSEFRRLTENSLAQRKIDNARILATSVSAESAIALDAESEQAWLRSLTDIRLVLASRLGLDHSGGIELPEGDGDNEELLMMLDIYHWLGSVQDSLVAALDER